jgi:uncharacterized membrane protein
LGGYLGRCEAGEGFEELELEGGVGFVLLLLLLEKLLEVFHGDGGWLAGWLLVLALLVLVVWQEEDWLFCWCVCVLSLYGVNYNGVVTAAPHDVQ